MHTDVGTTDCDTVAVFKGGRFRRVAALGGSNVLIYTAE